MAEWSNGKNGGRMVGLSEWRPNGGMAAERRNGRMAVMATQMVGWSNGGMVEWQEWRPNGEIVEWRPNGGMVEWRNGRMARMAEWLNSKNGGIVEWWNG